MNDEKEIIDDKAAVDIVEGMEDTHVPEEGRVDLHVDDNLRLAVHGVNKYMGRKEFRDFLVKNCLSQHKSVQKQKGGFTGYVSVRHAACEL